MPPAQRRGKLVENEIVRKLTLMVGEKKQMGLNEGIDSNADAFDGSFEIVLA